MVDFFFKYIVALKNFLYIASRLHCKSCFIALWLLIKPLHHHDCYLQFIYFFVHRMYWYIHLLASLAPNKVPQCKLWTTEQHNILLPYCWVLSSLHMAVWLSCSLPQTLEQCEIPAQNILRCVALWQGKWVWFSYLWKKLKSYILKIFSQYYFHTPCDQKMNAYTVVTCHWHITWAR